MKTTSNLLAACLLALIATAPFCLALDREHIKAAKAATAFLAHSNGSASAFSISEAGLFVTNDHVIEDSRGRELTLVLNPGTEEEASFQAEVVRRNKETDLALVRIELAESKPPATLTLAEENTLYETQELVAFGYPFGKALSAKKGSVPAISVNIGRITSLRKKDGVLDAIQLDAQVNPGNSGGPVLDEDGKVVGIISSGVRGSGVNFAIPIEKLFPLLQRPNLHVHVPEIPYDRRHNPVELTADLAWLHGNPPDGFTLKLEITTGKETEQLELKHRADGSYATSFVPIKPDPEAGTPIVFVQLQFPGGDLRGKTSSRDVKVGDETIPLVEISSIMNGEKPAVRPFGKSQIEGKATGLEELDIDLGGQVVTVDASKATKVSITPPSTELPKVSYRLVVADKESQELALAQSQVRIGPAPSSQGSASGGPSLGGGVALDGAKEIAIPAEIHDIDSAGNGKFLLLYLRDTRKLAIFDVTQLKITGYINLAEDPAVFAGGAEHILIAYPKSNLIVRYNLETREKERTVNNPLGTINAIGLGHSSSRFALMLAGAESNGHDRSQIKVFDMARMAPFDVGKVESHPFMTGTGNVLRSSADGRLYGCTKTSGSPSGVGIITFKNGKLTTRYEHDSRGSVVPNPDGSLIFTTYGGVYTPDYVSVVKANGNWSSGKRFVPSYHPMYFFAVPQSDSRRRSEDPPKTIEIYIKGSNQPLVSLGEEFEEMRSVDRDSSSRRRSPMTIDKRYHFIPQLELFLTIPETNDKIVARPLKVHNLLDKKEIDYLYVTSTPPPANPNTQYSYQIKVASRAGGIKFSLQSGPDGLDLSADGLVSWNIPETAKEESVIVSIADALGQETFYTFQIVVSK